MSNIAIQVEHLSKMYRLGVINNGTLWQDIQTFFALKFGKEDPHSKIGEDKYSGDKDHFWALKDISFEIKQGDRLGIIGKNGAGKSTLLKILSRITTPTEGTIRIKGKVTSLLEVGTGFHGELTGRENIYLNGAILGMRKRRIDEKIDSIIEFSGIEQHIDTPVKRYSSGMYVRLAFAVAAHLDSDILIADEVLAVGDAEFQKKALGKMKDLSTGEGRTVLFVSHNIGAVKNLCNNGIILEKGEIKNESDDINKLCNNYINNFSPNNSLLWENINRNIYYPFFTPVILELQEEDGSPIAADISADKKYRIKLVFDIEEIDPTIEFYLNFVDINGNNIFSFYEFLKDYKKKKGRNTIYFIIPDHILDIGRYIITLGLIYTNSQVVIHPAEYKVSIVMNIAKRNNSYTTPFLYTIIAPLLTWYSE
jgi:lipopolysaccharide transport system ATP-binding protein